ncbi:MAG: hypothetical protein IJP92_15135 [Lachnospiraceae bacterium]|nr:hypothetical protein [Lachnospiraceae bacterium]
MSRIFFRADANAQIGGGHMMRCLTIAECIAASGPAADDSASLYCAGHSAEPDAHIASRNGAHDAPVSAPWRTSRSAENMQPPTPTDSMHRITDTSAVTFICADEESARLPRQAGFETRVLGTDYREMEAEVQAMISVLTHPPASTDAAGDSPATIIVDSYYATDAYLSALREHARVVLIEDALTHTRPAAGIINYNLHASGCAYHVAYPSDTTDVGSGTVLRPPLLLIGPRYAPVRAQFAERRAVIRDDVRDILILCGASDPLNAATQIYHTLSANLISGQAPDAPIGTPSMASGHSPLTSTGAPCHPRFHIVCGAYNPHLAKLRALAEKDGRLLLHEQVEDMAALMCDCDLAVTAAGSTIYELCAVGLPFVAFSLADNQDPVLSALEAEDIASCAGLFYRDAAGTLQGIARHVTELSENVSLRKKRSEAQRLLVDGLGAARISREILHGASDASADSLRASGSR